MKLKNYFAKIGADRSLLILYVLAAIGSAVTIARFGALYYPDTNSYYDAWANNLIAGRIDVWRTPVYPIFLGLVKWIFGRYSDFMAICLQHLIFLVSIRYFYRLAMRFINSKRIVFGLTLLYIFPFMIWHNILETESLTLSGFVFLLYVVYTLRTEFSVGLMIVFLSLLVGLLFLRPASVYLLPVLFLWWGIVGCKEKQYKTALCGMACVLFAMMSVLGYMKAVEKEYGLFTISKIGLLNQLVIAFDRDLINTDIIQDADLRISIDECLATGRGGFDAAWYLLNQHDAKKLAKAIRDSYCSNPIKYIEHTLSYIQLTRKHGLVIIDHPNLAIVLDILGVNEGSFYLFLVLYTIILLLWMIKNRTIPSNSVLLYMLGVSHFIVVVVGAPNDWKRLLMASFPIYLLMLGQFCRLFFRLNPADRTLFS